MQIRKTYKYRLYHSKRNRHLIDAINVSGIIWNHCVALQRRYYRLTGKYIGLHRLQKHTAKLRMKTQGFSHWKLVGSQAVQDICDRIDKAYQRFFDGSGGIPSFKKVKKYRSFTLKQNGWKYASGNKVHIQGHRYKFVLHRPLDGTIKTITIKRDNRGKLWICFSVVMEVPEPNRVSTGKIGGFDFGLKTFLTDDEGRAYMMPEFFKQDIQNVRRKSRVFSRKRLGSRNREKARLTLAKTHEHLANKRRDFHFKLAHDLCDEYDLLAFETLNIKAMQHLWGRKMSDYSFFQFTQILRNITFVRGCNVIFIDRWEPTSQTCSGCGCRQKIELRERIFHCENCGLVLDRDHNAARNIKRVGASTLRSDSKTPFEAQLH